MKKVLDFYSEIVIIILFEILRNGVMVAQQTLTLYVRVRILHPLPNSGTSVPEFFISKKWDCRISAVP